MTNTFTSLKIFDKLPVFYPNFRQRRKEVEEQLDRIRDVESRIQKQNKLAAVTLDKIENDFKNTADYSVKLKRGQLLSQTTKKYGSDSSFERENYHQKENFPKLDKSEVDTLITRVHEYYERMYNDDQDQFFNSEKYIDADKYESIGRDLNVSHHERVFSPEIVPLATRKKPDFPRPMNLERRIAEKHQSPEKYR